MNLPDGWLTEEEATELQRIAVDKFVLELGAWKGRSTVCFAEVAELVISVDTHRGIPQASDTSDSLSEYLSNVRELKNVIPVIGNWNTLYEVLDRDAFDLVYVDGKHDALSAYNDFLLARGLSCIVAAHDWDFDSVREGAQQAGMKEPDTVTGSVAIWYE